MHGGRPTWLRLRWQPGAPDNTVSCTGGAEDAAQGIGAEHCTSDTRASTVAQDRSLGGRESVLVVATPTCKIFVAPCVLMTLAKVPRTKPTCFGRNQPVVTTTVCRLLEYDIGETVSVFVLLD